MNHEKANSPKKTVRKRYSDEYRAEALKLAENAGSAAAAKQLGIHESQLYGWRSKTSLRQNDNEQQQALLAENAQLKRQLSEQTEELAM